MAKRRKVGRPKGQKNSAAHNAAISKGMYRYWKTAGKSRRRKMSKSKKSNKKSFPRPQFEDRRKKSSRPAKPRKYKKSNGTWKKQ